MKKRHILVPKMRELLKLKRTLHYTFRAFIFAADNFVEPKKERNENYPGIHLFS